MINILFICSANVCRSPLGAENLTRLLKAEGITEVVISSAGTSARPDAERCLISREYSGQAEPEHRSQSVTRQMISGSDLILTAERVHRSAVVGIDPTSRQWTFTLKEATMLARSLSGRQHSEASDRPEVVFRRWVESLDNARGTVGAHATKGGTPLSLDIPDGHGRTRRRHRQALSEINEVSAAFGTLLLDALRSH